MRFESPCVMVRDGWSGFTQLGVASRRTLPARKKRSEALKQETRMTFWAVNFSTHPVSWLGWLSGVLENQRPPRFEFEDL